MIYLDHAAATPVSAKVLKAMEPYFSRDFFNPSAAYLPAKKVASEYEAAKDIIAHAIGAKAADLVITGGATEANNLAFTVLDDQVRVLASPSRSRVRPSGLSPQTDGATPRFANLRTPLRRDSDTTHTVVLYLETEHDSVRAVAKKHNGTAIRVLPNGLIDLDDLRAKITDETMLVSVSLANNELGTIQPMAEISTILKNIKIDRLRRGIKRPLYLHSDASQALNLLDINVSRLGVDVLTLNAAKVYGPKGVGALYVGHDVKLTPITVGGGQEKGLRSGTENVPGVAGFATAMKEAKEHLNSNRKKYRHLKQILLTELDGYELINKKHSLDSFVVLCYPGIDAERLIYLLEEKEVYVATGAACAASKGQGSHVLAAIGLSDAEINGSLRLTLGETNDEKQIHATARIINEVVKAERQRMLARG